MINNNNQYTYKKTVELFVQHFKLDISQKDINKFIDQYFPPVTNKRGRPKTATTTCSFILLKGQRKDEECGKSADPITKLCVQHRKFNVDYIDNKKQNDDDNDNVCEDISTDTKSVISCTTTHSNTSELVVRRKRIDLKNFDIKSICNTIESDDECDTKKITLKRIW